MSEEQIVTGQASLTLHQLMQMVGQGASTAQHLVSAAYTHMLIKAGEDGIELNPDTIIVVVSVEGRGTRE